MREEHSSSVVPEGAPCTQPGSPSAAASPSLSPSQHPCPHPALLEHPSSDQPAEKRAQKLRQVPVAHLENPGDAQGTSGKPRGHTGHRAAPGDSAPIPARSSLRGPAQPCADSLAPLPAWIQPLLPPLKPPDSGAGPPVLGHVLNSLESRRRGGEEERETQNQRLGAWQRLGE